MSSPTVIPPQPENDKYTGKFCLPEPVTRNGTFSTVPQYSKSISTIVVSGANPNIALATVAGGHDLSTNDIVVIAGATQAEYNGTVQVQVVDLNVFSYYFPGSLTVPATGTITAKKPGCRATGEGMIAGQTIKQGDFIYVASKNAIRQVKTILDDLHWIFNKDFPSDCTDEPIKVVPRASYVGISLQNTGGGTAVINEKQVTNSDPAISWYDEKGLNPVCGDASGTTVVSALIKKSEQ